MSPAKKSSAPDLPSSSPRSKPVPAGASAAVPPPEDAAVAEETRAAAPARAPADDEPPVKVPSAGSRDASFLSHGRRYR
jgi:hypothetical protein